jgi:hypothetical protein
VGSKEKVKFFKKNSMTCWSKKNNKKGKKMVHNWEGGFIVHPMDNFKNREMGLVCSWVLCHFD